MKFIEQLDKFSFNLHINVKVNSKRQDIIDGEEYLIVHVKSKPNKNKANTELIKLIKSRLKINSNQIKLISGIKNKNKLVKITFKAEGKKQLILDKLFGG
jgi:uncharacterized protein YggU (UPF0235/DUF167 family)